MKTRQPVYHNENTLVEIEFWWLPVPMSQCPRTMRGTWRGSFIGLPTPQADRFGSNLMADKKFNIVSIPRRNMLIKAIFKVEPFLGD